MARGWHAPVVVLVAALAAAWPTAAAAQIAEDSAVFRSAIDYVSITAVVRDQRGRAVPSLSREDFEILDAGRPRPIVDLRNETSAAASVALLVDGSGSMRLGQARTAALAISGAILDSLNPARDDAALFTFDTRLIALADFTHDFDEVRSMLRGVNAFGSTSLFDAIGGTAGIVARRTQNRRAIVVLTDGLDNASAYTASDISTIASSIDVPVYIFDLGVVASEPSATAGNSLESLAHWTGGEYFAAGDAASINRSIRSLIDELRAQYVVAFEAAAEGGWRSVEVKTRKRGLRVRSRAWYLAGSSE
jgi:Ca-activated chloride channel homolog